MNITAAPTVTILETERLLLKEITSEFHDFIFQNWSDEEIMNYMGFFEMANYLVEREKNKQKLVNYNISFRNFIMEEKDTYEVLGRIGFHTWYVHHNRAEIGYGMLKEEYKGRGYMTEALKPVLEYGFDVLHLNRVEAFIGPRNMASIKLVERFGFVKEGLLREHYCKNNAYEDSACYSLLKSEFETWRHGR